MQQNKYEMHLKRDRIYKDGNRLLTVKKESFYLLIQGKMGIQREKPHNKKLKYPMLISRRFYFE